MFDFFYDGTLKGQAGKWTIPLLGAVYMSPVNRASPGYETLSSATKGDLN